MPELEGLLSQTDEQEIIDAIAKAEKETSGEIRVHIERSASMAAFARATEVFNLLEIHKTKLRNGVLIYVATEDRAFAIIGDQGINDVVGTDFWDDTRDVMQQHFRNGDFRSGLIAGISRAGQKLQAHFPCEDDDTDELSNEISRS